MFKLILSLLLVVNLLNAFELRTWFLGNINIDNYKTKNTKEILKYTNQYYDVLCLQGITGEEVLSFISSGKNYTTSLNSNLAFLIKNDYTEFDLINYEDTNMVFENKPIILYLKEIDLFIVNFLASDNQEKRMNEIKEINNVYFDIKDKYKVDTNRILTCGNFKEQYGSVKKILGDLYSVSNNLGTVIDEKFGNSNLDYDHIISITNLESSPDESILKIDRDYKKIKEEISPHLPLILRI